jgi:tRNA uridine 5-carbamoylmethylation protein Kti12
MKQKLYLIRGLPGSGKSTFAEHLRSLLDSTRGVVTMQVEADHYFYDEEGNYNFDASKLREAHEYCQNVTRGALGLGYNAIVSNTSTTEKEVKVYQDISEQFGAKFISLIVENRHGATNVHNVPAEKIRQMKQRFSVKL